MRIKLHLLLLITLISPTATPFNWTVDYKSIKSSAWCEKGCYFEKPEITMKTIEKWPMKCTAVCAVLTFNENCDVPVEKLKSAFENLDYLTGGVRIQNTEFKDLQFLSRFGVDCKLYGILISNNSKLEDSDGILNIAPTSWNSVKHSVRIIDNPKLDARKICIDENFENIVQFEVSGNMFDCNSTEVENTTTTSISPPPAPENLGSSMKTSYFRMLIMIAIYEIVPN